LPDSHFCQFSSQITFILQTLCPPLFVNLLQDFQTPAKIFGCRPLFGTPLHKSQTVAQIFYSEKCQFLAKILVIFGPMLKESLNETCFWNFSFDLR
jgi:hypothetical protein